MQKKLCSPCGLINMEKFVDCPQVSGQNAEGEIKIPEGVRLVLSNAFFGYDQITSVTFPDTVWKIGDEAFGDCDGLEKVDMADSVVQFGNGAFAYCCKLQQIRLSKKLERIPGWCFADCGIREITIPQGCSLADGAFYYCAGTKWTFPPDAKNLGNLFQHIDEHLSQPSSPGD